MGKQNVSIAKLTPPRAEGALPRQRLFKIVDKGLARPLTWISGPPGSGKTTLASSYLESRKIPCIWYQVDEGDSDIATFFYYMGLAARKAAPKRKMPLPLLTPEYMLGVPTFTLRYFEELFSRLKPPYVLVLDNYQEAANDSMFHEVISNGMSVVPDGISVFVLSRSGAPAPFARLRANGHMGELGWDEIKLREDESRGMLRLMNEDITGGRVKQLHESCGGWAAGLVLLTRSLQSTADKDVHLSAVQAPEEIFDYFASEVFGIVSSETAGFMMGTSLFPYITPEMAEAITGIKDAGRILLTLHRNNFFTHKHQRQGAVYQYHPLFREFLRNKAREVLPSSELAVLEQRAAGLLEAKGWVEAAAELFISSGGWEGLSRLIMANAPSMLSQGRNNVLESWLKIIPVEKLEGNPWLMYWLGACGILFTPPISRPYLEKAFKMFRESGDTAGIYLAWSGIVDSITFESDDLYRLDEWISLLDGLRQEFGEFPTDIVGGRVSFSVFQALVFIHPGSENVEEWGRLAMEYSERCNDHITRSMTLFIFMFLWNLRGEPTHAKFVLDNLNTPSPSSGAPPLALLYYWMSEMFYYTSSLSYEDSVKAISRGLELAKYSGIVMHKWHMYGNSATGAMNAGHLEAAQKSLDEMALMLPRARSWDKGYYYFLKSMEAYLKHDLKLADRHMNLSLELIDKTGVPYCQLSNRLGKALVLNELGERKKAAELIVEVRKTAGSERLYHTVYMCLLAEARFALESGREKEGLSALKSAMELGREKSYQRWFLWFFRPPDLAKLCVKALESGIETGYVREMVRVRNLEPDEPPVHIEDWPWPVRIYTLGRFGVQVDDKPVSFTGKVQKKPLALLKALIALGGRDVSEDSLVEALWPDTDGDVAHRSFATTLHRLRRLLGKDYALQMAEGRLTLNPKYCWVDAWAFERGLNVFLSRISGDEDSAGVLDRAAWALSLYQGNFLDDIYETWIYTHRERLRGKFMHAAGRLSAYLQESDDYRGAAECCLRALEVDDLAEEFYQRLMECQLALGLRAEAVKTFRRCERTLSKELCIEPSQKTRIIYLSATKK